MPRTKGQRPTITDIARLANVSVWTVSHVLNNSASVSIAESTRLRVMEIAAGVSYRPNHAARALVGSKTRLVGIWMRTHVEYSAYYGRIQHCLQKIARRNGYHCIVEDVVLEEVEKHDFSGLMNWPMDGVIACDVSGPVEAYVEVNPAERLPIVNLGAFTVESIDSIKLELAPGMRDATRHLVETGCCRIAFVTRLPYDVRKDAYAEVMQEAGRPCEIVETSLDTSDAAYETLRCYAAASGLPDGLVCANDDIALGCARAAKALGASLPGDVAITGCDGIGDAEFQLLGLSTVKAPIEEMCENAWAMLLSRMDAPDAPARHEVVTPKFVIRNLL